MVSPKKPQDHKTKAEDDVFTYPTKSGETVTVPLLSRLKFGVVRKMRNLEDAEQAFTLVESVCDEKTLAIVDDMDQAEVAEFFEAWSEASGVTPGELAASDN